jgi:DNA-binding CsgD family transcriptional regulator
MQTLVDGRGRSRGLALRELTPREIEVLREMAEGRTNPAIGVRLHLSESAVEKHISSIFLKLGLTEGRACTAAPPQCWRSSATTPRWGRRDPTSSLVAAAKIGIHDNSALELALDHSGVAMTTGRETDRQAHRLLGRRREMQLGAAGLIEMVSLVRDLAGCDRSIRPCLRGGRSASPDTRQSARSRMALSTRHRIGPGSDLTAVPGCGRIEPAI